MSGGIAVKGEAAEGYHPACTRPVPRAGRGRLADTAASPSPTGRGLPLTAWGQQAPNQKHLVDRGQKLSHFRGQN